MRYWAIMSISIKIIEEITFAISFTTLSKVIHSWAGLALLHVAIADDIKSPGKLTTIQKIQIQKYRNRNREIQKI